MLGAQLANSVWHRQVHCLYHASFLPGQQIALKLVQKAGHEIAEGVRREEQLHLRENQPLGGLQPSHINSAVNK